MLVLLPRLWFRLECGTGRWKVWQVEGDLVFYSSSRLITFFMQFLSLPESQFYSCHLFSFICRLAHTHTHLQLHTHLCMACSQQVVHNLQNKQAHECERVIAGPLCLDRTNKHACEWVCASVCAFVPIKSKSKNDSEFLWPAFSKLLHQQSEIEREKERATERHAQLTSLLACDFCSILTRATVNSACVFNCIMKSIACF